MNEPKKPMNKEEAISAIANAIKGNSKAIIIILTRLDKLETQQKLLETNIVQLASNAKYAKLLS